MSLTFCPRKYLEDHYGNLGGNAMHSVITREAYSSLKNQLSLNVILLLSQDYHRPVISVILDTAECCQ
jgi:hypothetical protein